MYKCVPGWFLEHAILQYPCCSFIGMSTIFLNVLKQLAMYPRFEWKGMDLNILNFGTAIFFPAIFDSSSTCLSNHPNGSHFQDSIWTIRNHDRFGSSERLICIEFAESSLIIFSFFPNQRITSDHFLQEENNRGRRAKENMAEELNHPNTVGWWT